MVDGCTGFAHGTDVAAQLVDDVGEFFTEAGEDIGKTIVQVHEDAINFVHEEIVTPTAQLP